MLHVTGRFTIRRRLTRTLRWPYYLRTGFIILFVGISGCRKEPTGTIDPDFSYPYILSTRLSDSKINLDSSAAPALITNNDGTYTITDSIFAQVLDPVDGNNLQSCSYRLTPPGYSYATKTGNLVRSQVSGNSAMFVGAISFTINRSDVGDYLIFTTAQGITDYTSNSPGTILSITRRNARPMVFNPLVPDTLHRPDTGYRLVRFALSASDSDGLADIEKVFFKSINSQAPDFEQPMFDDGNLSVSGDSVALDGRYSRLLTLDSTATLGRKEFRFWARDKSGALSDSLVKFIVITTP